jgi:hypothetical protein
VSARARCGLEARALQLDALGQEAQLPVGQRVEVEREHDDRAAGDAAQLCEPGLERIPVVDRDAGHRRVDRAVVQRQRLGARVDRGRRPGRALRAHRRARLDGQQPAVLGLVRARSGAHVDDRARVAEGGADARGDARVGAAMVGVRAPVQLVVDALAHAASS